jgi:hypothetical protein
MASTEANNQPLSVSSERPSAANNPPPKRNTRLTSFWKALILTSFLINLVLIFVVLLLVGFIIQWQSQIGGTIGGVQGFARNNVAELRSVVAGLEGASIKTNIPLDSVTIPIKLDVPVNQETTVELTEAAQVVVEGADIDLGLSGRLRANVNLLLPVGTKLKIRLNLNIPIDQPLPLKGQGVEVPVVIPLKETELGPQFRRLGELVDRLAGPAAPLLGLDIPSAPPAPPVPTAVPK